jgi:hypothetical protein
MMSGAAPLKFTLMPSCADIANVQQAKMIANDNLFIGVWLF